MEAGFIAIFVFGLIGAVIVSVAMAMARDDRRKDIRSRLEAEHPGAKVFLANENWGFLVVNFDQNQIVLGRDEPEIIGNAISPAYSNIYRFDQIAEVTVEIDGATVSQTNRGSQLLGGAIGLVAAGGIGAIIGGLTGSKRGSDQIRNARLLVRIEDPDHPIHRLHFFKSADQGQGEKPNSITAIDPLNQLEQAEAQLAIAIRATQRNATSAKGQFAGSVADELARLASLAEQGHLSVEEFSQAKAKLLAE